MAHRGDQISMLANDFEKVSTSETLYEKQFVDGKGVGCFAIRDIRKGSLVLREFPVLHTPDTRFEREDITFQDQRQTTEGIIKAFLDMSEEDQGSYMKLYNKYNSATWSNGMEKQLESVMNATAKMTFAGISKTTAIQIWSIYATNTFTTGVCLNMSRFNHSCRSNADHFWNDDTNTRDLRALRKIKKGEEITLNYVTGSKTREERQAALKENYNFDCHCEACDSSQAQIKNETKCLELYREEKEKQKKFQENAGMASRHLTVEAQMHEEAECLKRMYRLAKEIKTFSRRLVLYEIIEEAVDVNCQGALSEQCIRNREEVKAAWIKDAKVFAAIGHTISATLFGDEHYTTTKMERKKCGT